MHWLPLCKKYLHRKDPGKQQKGLDAITEKSAAEASEPGRDFVRKWEVSEITRKIEGVPRHLPLADRTKQQQQLGKAAGGHGKEGGCGSKLGVSQHHGSHV